MTAPERIWAWQWDPSPSRGQWQIADNRDCLDTEYVRSDIHAALQAENERLREALYNPQYEHLDAACFGVNCYPDELRFILEQYCAALK